MEMATRAPSVAHFRPLPIQSHAHGKVQFHFAMDSVLLGRLH